MSNGDDRKAKLLVRVFDGTRKPIGSTVELLITLRDGFQKQFRRDFFRGPQLLFDVPFFNNLGDNYTVIAFADGYKQAGFSPVKISANLQQTIDLMLLPNRGKFAFRYPDIASLKQGDPELFKLLSKGAADESAAQARYGQLIAERPQALASLLNLTTAMDQIHLAEGTPLDYLVEVFWDETLQQDRFYAWADRRLIDEVKIAADQGVFAPELGAGFFHAGATLSYKQVQFGEANVQLSFHENDTREIDGVQCVKVEPDIDYFRDQGAHALLEVVPNHITGGLTDPEQVYLLRWIAGQRAGLPQFDPPYAIV